jgi:predicted acylesterase/phospholipase RssA
MKYRPSYLLIYYGKGKMKQKYPFKNLVFKGGGIKAFAYIGALEAFEQHNILSQIERVAGNSAGSTMATLVSFRKSPKETSTGLFERRLPGGRGRVR